MRVRLDQSYLKMNGTTAGHPATVAEKIVVSLDARDISASPGDQVNKFKETVAIQPYFQSILNKTNGVQLTSLSPPQNGPDGKPNVLFTLECDLPQQNR